MDEKLQGKQVGIASPLDRAAGSSLQGCAVGMEPADALIYADVSDREMVVTQLHLGRLAQW